MLFVVDTDQVREIETTQEELMAEHGERCDDTFVVLKGNTLITFKDAAGKTRSIAGWVTDKKGTIERTVTIVR